MGATDAHDGRMQKGKTEATAQPTNNIRVRGLPFSGEEKSQMLINNCSGGTHTTQGRKNQGAEAPMLNLSYMFFLLATLGSPMLAIRVRLAGRGKGVEYMDKSQPQKPDALMSR